MKAPFTFVRVVPRPRVRFRTPAPVQRERYRTLQTEPPTGTTWGGARIN